jgi:hypothetical protein
LEGAQDPNAVQDSSAWINHEIGIAVGDLAILLSATGVPYKAFGASRDCKFYMNDAKIQVNTLISDFKGWTPLGQRRRW